LEGYQPFPAPHTPFGGLENKKPSGGGEMKEYPNIKKIVGNSKNLTLYLIQFVPLLKLKF
jgi:hypothetical protein